MNLNEQIILHTALSKYPANFLLVEEKLKSDTELLWRSNISICPLDPPDLSKIAKEN